MKHAPHDFKTKFHSCFQSTNERKFLLKITTSYFKLMETTTLTGSRSNFPEYAKSCYVMNWVYCTSAFYRFMEYEEDRRRDRVVFLYMGITVIITTFRD